MLCSPAVASDCWKYGGLWLQDTVTDLKKKFHAKQAKYYPARQRLTLPAAEGQKSGEVLKDGAKLSDYGLTNGSVVQFKDLGTQVWIWPSGPAQSMQHKPFHQLLQSNRHFQSPLAPYSQLVSILNICGHLGQRESCCVLCVFAPGPAD